METGKHSIPLNPVIWSLHENLSNYHLYLLLFFNESVTYSENFMTRQYTSIIFGFELQTQRVLANILWGNVGQHGSHTKKGFSIFIRWNDCWNCFVFIEINTQVKLVYIGMKIKIKTRTVTKATTTTTHFYLNLRTFFEKFLAFVTIFLRGCFLKKILFMQCLYDDSIYRFILNNISK